MRLFVAIAYGKGVNLCKKFDPKLRFIGANYKDFIKENFPIALERSANPINKLILQDGCPVQKSKQAQLGYDDVGCKIFNIPARSPDLNPIENVFHLARKMLAKEAKDKFIQKESYAEFAHRVIRTIESVPAHIIDRTIDSLPQRMSMVIKSKGDRIKY